MYFSLIPATLDEIIPEMQPFHPLHVAVSKNDIQNFRNEYSRNNIFDINKINDPQSQFICVLFKKENTVFSNMKKSLCVYVHIIDAVSDATDSDCLHLHVTPVFLNHYCLSYGDSMYFRYMSCFPLTKIVLGAKSTEVFQQIKNENWQQKLLISTCQNKVLCRVGDALLASPDTFNVNDSSLFLDFVTLDCQPLGQGLLTVNSAIVITDVSTISVFKKQPEVSNMISSLKLFNYSDFVYLSTFSHIRPYNFSTVSPKLCNEHLILQPHIFPQLSDIFISALSEMRNDIDPLNTVFLSEDLFKKIGVRQGCWVKAAICSFGKSRFYNSHKYKNEYKDNIQKSTLLLKDCEQKYRLVTLCAIPDKNTYVNSNIDGTAYLSPHLWFNLNEHPSKFIPSGSELILEPLCKSPDFRPSYAKEVYIALVQSPKYDCTIDCDAILATYFKNPRYICKGDIFCICPNGISGLYLRNADFENVRPPSVHFRISMIEGDSSQGCLIDKEHTRLYQVGTAQSYVPVAMETFYFGYSDFWDSPIPLGIQHYVDMLQELIFPFLINITGGFHVSSNILLTGPTCCGKTTVVKAVCKCLNLNFYEINCNDLLGELPAATEAKLKILTEKASTYAPCIMLFKDIDFIGKEKELKGENSRVLSNLNELLRNINSSAAEWPIVVIATTSQLKLMSADLVHAFLHHVHIEAPNEEERTLIIDGLLNSCATSNDVSTMYLAQRTAGFVLGDLCALVFEAARCAYLRIQEYCDLNIPLNEDEGDVYVSGIPVIQKDLLSALEKQQSEYADAIGAPKIPNVFWADIGGLSNIKQEILDTIQLPLEHPEILFSGLRRSGVLLYGPPGTGKTLLAKAVATECSLNFLSVKGPELINMYVGQSEENVRAIFHQARSAVPCIIFFDELDSLAPNRGKSGDSGGVMDRVVSQLLAELDGLNKSAEVFVIGATNRPDLIDPALLRPGRFDRLLYVGIPEDKESKISILKALTRKLHVAEDVNFEEIIEQCPQHISGADFYSLCADAMMNRIHKNVCLLESGKAQIDEANISIQKEDFVEALQTLIPSVADENLFHYKRIKDNM